MLQKINKYIKLRNKNGLIPLVSLKSIFFRCVSISKNLIVERKKQTNIKKLHKLMQPSKDQQLYYIISFKYELKILKPKQIVLSSFNFAKLRKRI